MRVSRFILLSILGLALWSCSDHSVEPVARPPGNSDTLDTSVYHVPADYASIARAVHAASSGDTVLVADGVYSGDSNRGIKFDQKRIVLMSENGPARTILDAVGVAGASFLEFDILDSFVVVDGFTFRRGSSVEGGAVNMRNATPTFRNCVFAANSAMSGGAVRSKDSAPRFFQCTFVNNSATVGACFYFISTKNYPRLENCIIAYSKNSVLIDGGEPNLICSNIYGNDSGNYVSSFESLDTANNNISQQPLFCDSLTNFRLQSASPCAPANNACAELIGALDIGCP